MSANTWVSCITNTLSEYVKCVIPQLCSVNRIRSYRSVRKLGCLGKRIKYQSNGWSPRTGGGWFIEWMLSMFGRPQQHHGCSYVPNAIRQKLSMYWTGNPWKGEARSRTYHGTNKSHRAAQSQMKLWSAVWKRMKLWSIAWKRPKLSSTAQRRQKLQGSAPWQMQPTNCCGWDLAHPRSLQERRQRKLVEQK